MTLDEIKTFKDEFTAISEEQIISLKKSFNFGDISSLEIIRGLEVKKIGDPITTNQFNLVLKAKQGFEINGIDNAELVSELITININLIITPKEQISLSELEINSISETEAEITDDLLVIRLIKVDQNLPYWIRIDINHYII